MHILILNGPNLNLLGTREPTIYGTQTYQDLVNDLTQFGKTHQCTFTFHQTNYEGEIIDFLHQAYFDKLDGIILNAGAYTHYSYAIRDAIAAIHIPVIEVHLSDITKRETFRKKSVLTDVCSATFMGKSFDSYKEAILFLLRKETKHE